MISFLSGGTGTPKLLRGMREVVGDGEIGVAVNTAEDVWISGNHLSPDVDTVLYLFAGILDTSRWWGVEGDTFITHDACALLGGAEQIKIGDRDRAVHIARGERLRRGERLTTATLALSRHLGVKARVLPMTDTPVASLIETPEGWIHFQDYWVAQQGRPPVYGVRREPGSAMLSPEVEQMIHDSEAVVIGPSNPVTSILPIIECKGMVELLKDRPVIAVSPFIGDAPVSGPAGVLMKAIGSDPNALGTYRLYQDFVDVFIQDTRDPVLVPGSIRLDTLMTDAGRSRELASAVVAIVRELAS